MYVHARTSTVAVNTKEARAYMFTADLDAQACDLGMHVHAYKIGALVVSQLVVERATQIRLNIQYQHSVP